MEYDAAHVRARSEQQSPAQPQQPFPTGRTFSRFIMIRKLACPRESRPRVFATGVLVQEGSGEFVLDFVQALTRPALITARVVVLRRRFSGRKLFAPASGAGSSFRDRFDANSYLYITRAMDYFDLAAEYDGSVRRRSPGPGPGSASSRSPATGCSRPAKAASWCTR